MIKPVSCWGKKPFGTASASRKVKRSVAMVTASVSGW